MSEETGPGGQVAEGMSPGPDETSRRTALARALLDRHGVLTREAAQAEEVAGGFSAVYEVLRAMEEAGKVRRGYFVEGLGAAQFAVPGAEDRLRALREPPAEPVAALLASTDPANPYGAALPWPERVGVRPARSAGTSVVLIDGALNGNWRQAFAADPQGGGLPSSFIPKAFFRAV